jgi:hypothetical protein
MRHWIIILLLVMCVVPDVMAQRSRGIMRQRMVSDGGDSILQVDIAPVMAFSRPVDLRRYQRLVNAVKVVYPMAQLAKQTMHEMEDTLLMLDKKDQRQYIKQCYKQIVDEYTPVATRMTRTQGRVFIKLIDRETDQTAFEVIREFRGGFVASFWQGIGRLFGHNLKTEYGEAEEDRVLEQIIVNYQAGLL